MKAVGIILAGGRSSSLGHLTRMRATAALPVGGSYRAIDFALSSMVNSGINKVAVITQYNSRSLNDYLSAPTWWGFGRKLGGLFIKNPSITADNGEWYRGTADSMAQNLDFLTDDHEPYVIVASGDGVYALDYEKVLNAHIQSNAELTVVCKRFPEDVDVSRFGVVNTDEKGVIVGMQEKPENAAGGLVSCGIYVMRRRFLIRLLESAAAEGQYDFVNDLLAPLITDGKCHAYEHDGYWANINTISAYYACNMDFLKAEVQKEFFGTERQVLTPSRDFTPTKYLESSQVSGSVISTGCVIEGDVQNCVIFGGVHIGKGTVVRDSVILPDVQIGENCLVSGCIVNTGVEVETGSVLRPEEYPVRIVASTRE